MIAAGSLVQTNGVGLVIPPFDIPLNMCDQRVHRVRGPAAHRLASQDTEPGLHHVQSGGPGRGEVNMHSETGLHPCSNIRRLVQCTTVIPVSSLYRRTTNLPRRLLNRI